MKKAIRRKKDAHKARCRNSTENKNSKRNKAQKATGEAMEGKADVVLSEMKIVKMKCFNK